VLGDPEVGAGAGAGAAVAGAGAAVAGAGDAVAGVVGLVAPAPDGAGLAEPGSEGIVRLCFCASGMTNGPF